MPLGSRLQGTGECCSLGPGGPAGMLPLPPLPLGCLLPGVCGEAVSLGDRAEPPPACLLLRRAPAKMDLAGQEMSPWQPTLSWELAQGRWEEEEEEDGHGEPGRG